MNYLFIPYELALKLKEKGFDEPCLAIFGINNSIKIDESTPNTTQKDYHKDTVLAPLYQQVIDWFREKHKISITLKHYPSGSFSFSIQKHNGDATGWSVITAFMEKSCNDYYENFNNAIEKALKLI